MTTLEANRLSSLVGEIYDAAVNPAQRNTALEQVAGFVGGSAVTILSRDAARLSIEIHQHYGTDLRFRELYRDRYVELDPLLDRHLRLAVEQTIGVADVMPYSDFVTTSFYREWVEPQGAVDLASVTLERSSARTTILQVMRGRSRGAVDDSMRERMRLIAPHIQRSRVMGRQIRARSHTVADLAEVLDRLSTAICLFDGEGRVVHANAACRQMLADGGLIAIVGDRIVARNTQADKIFRSLFDVVADDGTHSTDRRKIELMTSADGQHYLAHVFPLTHERALQRDGAATALFLQKASMVPQLATAAIAAAFRLTPSELRVLMAIVELGGVPDIAEKLGIAETTVKTHLGRLFEKTGAGRQADLVKIAAGFAAPFALPAGSDDAV
ncbi:helix-turn-helix transcriptional regulator [Bradyrhizobium manausense]|uniref:helix-turn-helix transcriptional regulator n=1 Tax=Bradyrhizobium manausense TaxID=989370 RepID=UPI001BAA042D|nr:helix-turn-helix transcriptional regulator [Bradyrhizobium manausense]MBR0690283.1 helix-turn-helix transcriptional regulator [Bradyrhizobium manausense]MBR0722809.1 helix-turn-helix transcriptional regulator [Bradyrhizobium manausense]MBR0832047.1 helix-turn-helix transcriptional regulator [Bradyrhizobium manausense]